MDKFGIFNLLSSFFNFYQQNKQSQDGSSEQFNFVNALSSLGKTQDTTTQKEQNTQPKNNHIPLQASMLATMTSHDQFVKRVKEKNGNQKWLSFLIYIY